VSETAQAPPDWRDWPPAQKQRLLDRLRQLSARPWTDRARENQLSPSGDWFGWLILAGRGWGKTRTGAEWCAEKARTYRGCRIALVAQTYADGRDTMVEGESGLASSVVLADHEIKQWNRSLGELILMNGSRFKVFSSEKPRQLRGPQHHFGWGDEPFTWYDAKAGPAEDTTWSNFVFGLRLSIDGSSPQWVATGTPKPVALLTQRNREPQGLLLQEGVELTRGHTDENLGNLAPAYRRRVVEPMRHTRLGRQELAAEVLGDIEGALWRREWIDQHRATADPPAGYQATCVALDPSDGTAAGSEQGICVAGLGLDNDFYVIASEGHRGSTYQWLIHALELAKKHGALIVIEKNHGGQALVELLEQAMVRTGIRAPYRVVWASQGKRTRAEPVAQLYEAGKHRDRGRVRHLGEHPILEEQMTTWTPGEPSPDRMDALVWAIYHLMGFGTPDGSGVEQHVHKYTDDAVPGVHRWQ
jgi:phage terminase large subunit-like protein